MNRRELNILAILTGIVLLLTAAMYNIRYQSGDQEYIGTLWLENLDINSVTRIDITGPGNMPQVTLERRPEGWGVVQRQHYPANVGTIRSLLLDLSEAKLLERKTRDPAQHAQLGLGGIERLEAKGQQVTLHSAEGTRSVRIATARPRMGAAPLMYEMPTTIRAGLWIGHSRFQANHDAGSTQSCWISEWSRYAGWKSCIRMEKGSKGNVRKKPRT